MKNAASVTDAPATQDARGGRTERRSSDAGGTVATVTFIALLAIALGVLGYMVAIR
ncbi:hypothetical protein ACWGH4_07585 [Streptomyces sp. NPDC054847]|uniref:hypothetical protein n=1 Tax=Streptomyces sp. OZ13 TaxID=3452210 RepID=UPI003F8A5576